MATIEVLKGKYKCRVCKLGFQSKNVYDKHRKSQQHKAEAKAQGVEQPVEKIDEG